jgi:hypothetical protein
LTTGTSNGQTAVAVFDLESGAGSVNYLADAPFNSTTMALPVDIEQLCTTASACLSASSPRFTYHAVAFSQIGGSTDVVDGTASFNAFSSSLSTGTYAAVAPNASVTASVTIDKTEFAQTPAKGFLVMSHDNPSNSEAQLIPVTVK